MAKIAVDIDSTLYDFPSLACKVMGQLAEERMRSDHPLSLIEASRLRNAAYSTTWAEWRTPIDLAGAEAFAEVVDICHQPETILEQAPYPGATSALWDLHDAGHELAYVSNRNASTEEPTRRWLEACGFPLVEDGHTLLCHTDDKLASIRDCQYLIDDRPKTLVQFVHGRWNDNSWTEDPSTHVLKYRKAFGLVHPYNRGLTDVPGIYLAPNWPLLATYLRDKIPSEVVV